MPQLDSEGKPYIELCNFLKIKDLAQTGGQAKVIIRNKEIKVNNVVETRNKLKLRNKDLVEFQGKKYIVVINEF